jgi:predicted DNA-binding protein
MIRTQIQLTEEQAARLKAVAARRGISMAEVIRQAVDSAVSRTGDRDPDYLAGSYAP